jgi:Ras-related GTP-binding protein A/B
MEHYFSAQRDNIFRNVEVLIYVFDVESREIDKDIHYYQSCLESMAVHSPNAKIFCLIHKMDLVPETQRESVFKRRVEELETYSKPLIFRCFQTSIWDETLYRVTLLLFFAEFFFYWNKFKLLEGLVSNRSRAHSKRSST